MIGSGKLNRATFFERFDSLLFLAMLALTVISVFAVYSAGVNSNGVSINIEWAKQIAWVLTGFGLYLCLSIVSYEYWQGLVLPIYLVALFLLGLVLFIGKPINGSLSWLGIGPFGIQPAEFAKVVTVLTIASYWESSYNQTRFSFKNVAMTFVLVIPFLALILVQPDAGSAASFVVIIFIMLFLAGVSLVLVLGVAFTVMLTVFYVFLAVWQLYLAKGNFWFSSLLTNHDILLQMILTSFAIFVVALLAYLRFKRGGYWFVGFMALINTLALSVTYAVQLVLKPYQMDRLITFLDPNYDAQGAGYQVLQSLIAIGSGGFWGKGYLKGSHSHLRYLPEQSTDFIFSIILEEFGFIGGITIIGLLAIILIRVLYIANRSSTNFGCYLCYGAFAVIFFHTLVNVGMVIGVLPITGIPLLLLSYGGSSIWMVMCLLGLCNSVYIRRYKN